MSTLKTMIEKAKIAREATLKLAALKNEVKNKALVAIAAAIKKNSGRIIGANEKDVTESKKAKISDVLIKRLLIDGDKISEIIEEIESVAKLDDPNGKILSQVELDRGLMLYQETCPIGVIGAIFESRPDALVQIAALCIKSGNAVILKGGSEAKNSNRILVEIISDACEKNGIPKGAVQLIETRDEVSEMLKMNDFISMIIPRGSNNFVKYVQQNTSIPVLGHSDGICHVFIDESAEMKKALNIAYDAKCQYPAVCNAMETLIVHKNIAKKFLPEIAKKYAGSKVEVRGDEETGKILKGIKKATELDWKTEYNDLVLSIKIVNNLSDAVSHINKYGSKHTEAIVTENKKNAEEFMDLVDAASVMWNASTRFADGFRYGKGAEVGISTSKIHARGPVGLEGLVIYKYKLVGHGQIVGDYSGKNAKKFLHKKIK